MQAGGTDHRSPLDADAQQDAEAARGVTEIRVHGVGGTPPADLLKSAEYKQVAGDRIAGFFRTTRAPRPDRHTEAYCWGGLTSGGRSRALWLVLLPFTLANLAGWASKPRPVQVDGLSPVHGFRVAATRLAGLSLTVGSLLLIAMLSMDVLAFQCGAQPACAGETWWLAPLTWGDLPNRPVRRLVVGAFVPLVVIGVMAILSYTSRSRYEEIPPPFESVESPAENTRSAASAAGLADPGFWSGRAAHARLSRIHLTVAVALVTVILTFTGYHTAGQASHVELRWLGWLGLGLAVVAIGAAVLLLSWDWLAAAPTAVALTMAVAGFSAAGWAAWQQPPQDTAWAGQTPGIIAAANTVWIGMLALLLPLFLTFLGSGHEPPERTAADGFRWVSPFTILAVGVLLAHLVLLAVLLFVADFVSPVTDAASVTSSCFDPTAVEFRNEAHCVGDGPAPIVLPPIVQVAVSYFVWFGLAWLLILAAVLTVRYWRSGRGRGLLALGRRRGGQDDYEGEVAAAAKEHRADRTTWLYSAARNQFPDSRDRKGLRFALRRWLRRRVIDGDKTSANATAWTRSRARFEFLAGASPFASSLVNGMVLTALATAGVVWFRFVTDRSIPPGLWAGAAVALAVAIPPAVVGFITVAWRNLGRRQVIGTIWDVGTFWPRSFHPFAPPCYAERAVPELTRRVWFLNDNKGQVVLVAHSQGSIIAAAAALRSDVRGANGPRFSLVTFGSPLRKLYGQAFPAYWNEKTLAMINDPNTSLVIPQRPPDGGSTRWRNLYYLTDYIGGPVGIPDVDRRLLDPATSLFQYGQPPPPIVTHTGYWLDRDFNAEVNAMIDKADHVVISKPPTRSMRDESKGGGGATSYGIAGFVRLLAATFIARLVLDSMRRLRASRREGRTGR